MSGYFGLLGLCAVILFFFFMMHLDKKEDIEKKRLALADAREKELEEARQRSAAKAAPAVERVSIAKLALRRDDAPKKKSAPKAEKPAPKTAKAKAPKEKKAAAAKPKPAAEKKAAKKKKKKVEGTPDNPAVPVDQTIKADGIVCMICGGKYKLLTAHLKRAHNLEPDQYRAQFKLDAAYPMTPPKKA